MKNSILIPSIIALSFLVCFIQTYPTGAPKCSSKVPKHESHKPQTGESPYTLTAKKNGKTATVGISGGSFKGFFIYAVQPGSSDMIGTFQTNDKVKELSCGSASAATHANEKSKNSITLTWKAPDNFSGEVEFKATVVKEFKKFWTGITSSSLKF
ncbi:Putative defense protein 3 [Sarcoptes scabiei]|uniref:Putative defense protein 3 n=1 Tax=Sarcoptes scabiei TaxID=52283 RepID=A0A834RGE8_SARSC|nr:Putative defense protein 3 [Sarcoptes scabiei]